MEAYRVLWSCSPKSDAVQSQSSQRSVISMARLLPLGGGGEERSVPSPSLATFAARKSLFGGLMVNRRTPVPEPKRIAQATESGALDLPSCPESRQRDPCRFVTGTPNSARMANPPSCSEGGLVHVGAVLRPDMGPETATLETQKVRQGEEQLFESSTRTHRASIIDSSLTSPVSNDGFELPACCALIFFSLLPGRPRLHRLGSLLVYYRQPPLSSRSQGGWSRHDPIRPAVTT